MKILITIFAGLGLFFIGVRLFSNNLKQMSGPRMRAMVSRAVGSQRSASVLGLLTGAVMQNVNAVILVLSSLVSAGVMDTRKAIPVINWANLGTSLLVLIASFSIDMAVLTLIGLTGVLYYRNLDQQPRYRHLVGAMLGIGLLFLGIDLIKEGTAPLKYDKWMHDTVASWATSMLPSMLMGFAVTLIVQSSSTITIIAMTLSAVGVLDMQNGLNIVLGAIFATGVTAWLLGPNLSGSPRQLVLYQFMLKTSGVLATFLLLQIESLSGLPMIRAAFDALGLSPQLSLAVFYICVQVMCDLVIHPFHHRIEHWLQHVYPPTEVEVMGKPRFITEQSLDEPESALVLAEMENHRLVGQLPAFLDPLREDAGEMRTDVAVLHAAGRSVASECGHFLTRIADQHHSREVLERSILLRQRIELLTALQDTLVDFKVAISAAMKEESLRQLLHNLVESLHMMLDTLAETEQSASAADIELLSNLTYDRSDLMDGIRRRCLGLGGQIDRAIQESLFSATSLFERAVWLIHRYVLLIEGQDGGETVNHQGE